MDKRALRGLFLAALAVAGSPAAQADEGLWGYIKGAEPLPKSSWDFEQSFTYRWDKGSGTYEALDTKTEFEYGVTDRFSMSAALFGLGINTQDIRIDAYIPADEKYGWKPNGIEAAAKYNYLSAAKDDIGVSQYIALSYFWKDVNSGQDKDSYSFETILIVQKYFLEGQLILAGNLGLEATNADRSPIDDLPPDFEWPTTPEMEIEITVGGGLSYRFAPNWFVGVEALYQSERETVVGQERWSLQAGPNLHYGGKKWWATLTWLPQLIGGPEYEGQKYSNLHLIEKTKNELRLRVGYNF
jgi:hypothetical protein